MAIGCFHPWRKAFFWQTRIVPLWSMASKATKQQKFLAHTARGSRGISFFLFFFFSFIYFIYIYIYIYSYLAKFNFEACVSYRRPRARRTRGCASALLVKLPKKKRKMKNQKNRTKIERKSCGPWPSLPSAVLGGPEGPEPALGSCCTAVSVGSSTARHGLLCADLASMQQIGPPS